MIILFSIFIIYHVRSFVLAAIAAPIFMAFGARLNKRYEKQFLTKLLFRSYFIWWNYYFLSVFCFEFAEEMVTQAQVVQQDFTKNEIYKGKRYEIVNTDASSGLLRAIPESKFLWNIRPFINESISPTLFTIEE